MPRGYDADQQPLAEGVAEELDLALGGPARDLGALVGVEVEPDLAVLHVDVRRANALVARALEILGEAQQAREPVQALQESPGRASGSSSPSSGCPLRW